MINSKHLTWLASTMVMAVVAAGTFSQEITLEGVNANLQQLKAHHFLSEVPPQEIAALKRTATSFSQASDSWAAILQLWVAGQHDFVELLWWQKDDPETRAFIVSLEWCTVTLPDKRSGIWPAGIHNYERMSERFEPTERALRIREIDFVRQNRQTLAKQLGAILLANHIQMAEQYKTVAEQATPRNQD